MPALLFSAPTRHAVIPPPSHRRFARSELGPVPQGEPVLTRDGGTLHLRSIEPEDVDALRRCFTRLSPQDIRRRFLHPMSQLPEPMAQRLCNIDPASEAAFVLIDHEVEPTELRGVGRIFIDDVTESAEFSVLVEQAWSGRGLGALLMRHLVAECRARGLRELWGYVLMENRPMLHLCDELGFRTRMVPDEPGVAQLTLAL